MNDKKQSKFPDLTPDEWDIFTEHAGKLIASGIDEKEADFKAWNYVLDKRKPKEKKINYFLKISGAAITPIRWVVKNFIEVGALGMIFGDSGTYKSFLSVALSASIATGHDFLGMPVRRKGAVYYVAAEGQSGLIRRFRAWSQENKPIIDAPIYRYIGGVNLLEAAHVLSAALEEAIKTEPEPPVLAVIDTWSRSLGDDDSDTSAAAEGLSKVDELRAKFPDMAFLIIHHTGHSNKERARGASLLRAAVDCEYRLELDKDRNIIMTNTKSKESEPMPTIAFKAKSVSLLHDDGRCILTEDGEIEASAVLERIEYKQPIDGVGLNQKWILEKLEKAEGNVIELSELISAFKYETNKRKSHFDQSLESLEIKNLVYLVAP